MLKCVEFIVRMCCEQFTQHNLARVGHRSLALVGIHIHTKDLIVFTFTIMLPSNLAAIGSSSSSSSSSSRLQAEFIIKNQLALPNDLTCLPKVGRCRETSEIGVVGLVEIAPSSLIRQTATIVHNAIIISRQHTMLEGYRYRPRSRLYE